MMRKTERVDALIRRRPRIDLTVPIETVPREDAPTNAILRADRVSGAFFYDVGGTDKATISSAGAEITAVTQILTWNATIPIRVGVAYSLRGEVDKKVYVAVGQNF